MRVQIDHRVGLSRTTGSGNRRTRTRSPLGSSQVHVGPLRSWGAL